MGDNGNPYGLLSVVGECSYGFPSVNGMLEIVEIMEIKGIKGIVEIKEIKEIKEIMEI